MQNLRKGNRLPAITRLARATIQDSTSGCWLYQGRPICKAGHCRIGHHGIEELIHRFSYRTFVGPIPKDKFILHRCIGHPNCWNPDHLYAGTALENSRDMKDQGRSPNRFGEKNPKAKLNNEIVRKIKLEPRSIPSHLVGEKFGVSGGAVRHIRNGYTWNQVRI